MDHSPYKRGIWVAALLVMSGCCIGQTLKIRTQGEPANEEVPATPAAPAPITVDMNVPAGTPIKVALDGEVRVRKVGQPIHGRTMAPVYAFDKLLIPVGTGVSGKVSGIDSVPKKKRTLDAMDGNFSPIRGVHVQFDKLEMADGRKLAVQTLASPAPVGVLKFVSANAKTEKKNKVEDAASKKVSETRQRIQQQWSDLQKQIHEPGKMHKLKRLAVGQLPVHPQYIDAGTSFNADLLQPLDFGTEFVKVENLAEIGTAPPSGSAVHARLITALNSATSKKGDRVEALITEPLVASDHLILPEGSVIRGSVMQAQPARRWARNGQLRILFHEVAPPNGIEQKVVTNLEGVAVAKGEHLKLDSEGGAQVTTPRTRYLTTGIQVMLAARAAAPDGDHGLHGSDGSGNPGGGAVTGASGFRFVGMAIGMLARSRVVSAGFGAYGAANGIYYRFLARGREVVYPKDMAMLIGLGAREPKPQNSTAPADGAAEKSPGGQ
ncbi:MAG TPA: hypothetical protein VFE61_26615 [Candidatus Sulfotelmatobacter sp.]|jgi:hypothetical protein|nr:hypothetical protein [Candidatus Sulfotelmatobacter sp.]